MVVDLRTGIDRDFLVYHLHLLMRCRCLQNGFSYHNEVN